MDERTLPSLIAEFAEPHNAELAWNEEFLRLRSDYRQALFALRQMQAAYGHFVPKDFLHLLGSQDILNVRLGDGIERKITVMFTDIRNFTSLSEGMTSQETFRFINSYLSQMEPSVQRNGGIIDKFIGDAVMALFPQKAENALDAALSMRKALDYYNEGRRKSGVQPINMGIGLNTGITTLGVVGHMERMATTVIGDAVNVAQRIEELTKHYRVGILISEDTLANLSDPNAYSVRFVDRVQVKGRLRPLSVYEVFDGDAPELARGKLASLEIFEKAVAYYHLQEVSRALPLFERCREGNAEDSVVGIYLERCQRYIDGKMFEGASEFQQQLEWLDSYNTGFDEVDEQHRTLLDHINRLSATIQSGGDMAAVGEVFDFLGRYGVEHFTAEEDCMKKYDYPFRDEHIQEHAAFIRGFTATKNEIMSGRHDKLLALFRINLFLYDWLISHSTRNDKHWVDFVLKKMGRGAERPAA